MCSAGMQPVEVISDGLVQNPLQVYCVVKPDVQTSSFWTGDVCLILDLQNLAYKLRGKNIP